MRNIMTMMMMIVR